MSKKHSLEEIKKEQQSEKKIIVVKTNIVYKGISFMKGAVDINTLSVEDRKKFIEYLRHNGLIEE